MYIQRASAVGAAFAAVIIGFHSPRANGGSVSVRGVIPIKNAAAPRTFTGSVPFFTNSGSVALVTASLARPGLPAVGGLSVTLTAIHGTRSPKHYGAATVLRGSASGGKIGSGRLKSSLSPALAVADFSFVSDATSLLASPPAASKADDRIPLPFSPPPIGSFNDFNAGRGASNMIAPPTVPTPSAVIGGLLLLAGTLLGRRG